MTKLNRFLIPLFMLGFASHGLAKEHVITQKGKLFSPTDISLAPGDTIIFKNDDDTSHNVFASTEGMKFNLGIQKSGTETSHKFESPGDAEVRCAIHPKMKLKVTVKN